MRAGRAARARSHTARWRTARRARTQRTSALVACARARQHERVHVCLHMQAGVESASGVARGMARLSLRRPRARRVRSFWPTSGQLAAECGCCAAGMERVWGAVPRPATGTSVLAGHGVRTRAAAARARAPAVAAAPACVRWLRESGAYSLFDRSRWRSG